MAIIMGLASMVIRSLVCWNVAANETPPVNSLRTLVNVTAIACYPLTTTDALWAHPLILDSFLSDNGFGNSSVNSDYISKFVPGGHMGAYPDLGWSLVGSFTYYVTAVPVVRGSTGMRGFYVDTTGVIRVPLDGTSPAKVSPALQ
jgi:hypothetical protein